MFVEFYFRRGLFYFKKCQISNSLDFIKNHLFLQKLLLILEDRQTETQTDRHAVTDGQNILMPF